RDLRDLAVRVEVEGRGGFLVVDELGARDEAIGDRVVVAQEPRRGAVGAVLVAADDPRGGLLARLRPADAAGYLHDRVVGVAALLRVLGLERDGAHARDDVRGVLGDLMRVGRTLAGRSALRVAIDQDDDAVVAHAARLRIGAGDALRDGALLEQPVARALDAR